MKSLTDLANEFGTDKGTLVGNRHHYSLTYEKFFAGMRGRDLRLLEIGLSIGGPEQGYPASRQVVRVPSVEMWLAYFPKARITGLDISDCSQFQVDRFDFIQADCGNQEALRAAATGREFDIIIDDGSHASFHQQLTMLELFPSLARGGYYIVEDLDWQPEAYEQELPPVAKMADLLTWLKTAPTKDAFGLFNESAWRKVAAEVESVILLRKSDLEGPLQAPHVRSGWPWRRRAKSTPANIQDPIKLAIVQKK